MKTMNCLWPVSYTHLQYEAAKKLIEDFGLDIKVEDRNKYKRTHQSRNTLISKKPKVVMIREKLEQWLKHATDVLIRYLKWIQFWKEFYRPEPELSLIHIYLYFIFR